MKSKIIYEDKDLLVIHKPAGLATQTARVGQPDVVSECKNYLKSPYLGIVHRLDQPVEGLLVFAKNKDTAAELSKQLGQGTLNKQYYAVICGKPAAKQGELVDYLYKEGNQAAVAGSEEERKQKEAKKAVLQYRLAAYQEEQKLSLLEIHIDTGRFHQIRVQMAGAGMALLGDAKYGNAASKERSAQLGIRSVALCAYCLDFRHPKGKQEMHFQIKPEESAFRAYFSAKFL